jgi:hypothetical protein
LVESRQPSNDFKSLFQGDTEISQVISELSISTDLNGLKKWAIISPKEEQSIELLDLEVARLKSQDLGEQAEELSQSIDDVAALMTQIEEVSTKLSDQVASTVGEKLCSAGEILEHPIVEYHHNRETRNDEQETTEFHCPIQARDRVGRAAWREDGGPDLP